MRLRVYFSADLLAALARISRRCMGRRFAQTDPLPSWNDGAVKKSHHRFRRARHHAGRRRLRAAGRAHRHVRQRRHAVVRAAGLFPGRLCARSHQGDGAGAPRMEDEQPFKALLEDDRKALAAAGEKGLLQIMAATHTRHDDRRVHQDRCSTGSRPRGIRASIGRTPSSSTSRCWSCSPTCARTASRPSSSPAAASNSCGRGRRRSTAFRRSRSSARRA